MLSIIDHFDSINHSEHLEGADGIIAITTIELGKILTVIIGKDGKIVTYRSILIEIDGQGSVITENITT